jgi:hypothetical protein
MNELKSRTEADSLIEALKGNFAPSIAKIGRRPDGTDIEVLIAPKGQEVTSLKKLQDEFRDRPYRRVGVITIKSLNSFIDITNRFKDAHSAIFADNQATEPSLTTVFNYNEAGGELGAAQNLARFNDHRAVYNFPLSKEWMIWRKFDGKPMSQADFAAFLEERIADVMPPDPVLLGDISEAAAGGDFGDLTPTEQLARLARLLKGEFAMPQRLMELSRGLSVNDSQQATQSINLSTGEATLRFTSTHTDQNNEPIKVPNLFLISIPVFNLDDMYLIAARLRYRLNAGSLTWFYQLYRLEQTFDHAFDRAVKKAAEQTGLPSFIGQPERVTA